MRLQLRSITILIQANQPSAHFNPEDGTLCKSLGIVCQVYPHARQLQSALLQLELVPEWGELIWNIWGDPEDFPGAGIQVQVATQPIQRRDRGIQA